MTNAVAVWFANNLGHIMPAELVCFIVSLFPILECREIGRASCRERV